MKNPFITLTDVSSNRKIRVNILHIITYAPMKYSDSNKTYTYMTNASPAFNDTSVKETVEQIDRMIEEYYDQSAIHNIGKVR